MSILEIVKELETSEKQISEKDAQIVTLQRQVKDLKGHILKIFCDGTSFWPSCIEFDNNGCEGDVWAGEAIRLLGLPENWREFLDADGKLALDKLENLAGFKWVYDSFLDPAELESMKK